MHLLLWNDFGKTINLWAIMAMGSKIKITINVSVPSPHIPAPLESCVLVSHVPLVAAGISRKIIRPKNECILNNPCAEVTTGGNLCIQKVC